MLLFSVAVFSQKKDKLPPPPPPKVVPVEKHADPGMMIISKPAKPPKPPKAKNSPLPPQVIISIEEPSLPEETKEPETILQKPGKKVLPPPPPPVPSKKEKEQ